MNDRDGAFHEASVHYLAEHPEASFEEVEANCFPGADGGIAYYAISPRHLEACATRTAQVLIEGSYNGILRPGEHYLELRRDFSNLDDVLDAIADDSQRARLTDAAYRDVVASGAYTYERLVRDVEAVALAGSPANESNESNESWRVTLLHAWARAADKLSWICVAAWVSSATRLRTLALRLLPEPALRLLRRAVAGTAAETAALQSAE